MDVDPSEIKEVQIAEDVVNLLKAVKEGSEAQVIQLLEHNKELVNEDEGSGRTALHFAAHSHNAALIELLVSRFGANVNATDMDQYTPLMLAAVSCNNNSGGASVSTSGVRGVGGLPRAAEQALDVLIRLGADVNHRTSKGVSALHKAAAVGNVAMVRYLVSKGARAVESEAAEFGSVLHFAVLQGDSPAASELIELLVGPLKADINARDTNGGTPLHIAAAQGNIGVVKTLLRLGADASAQAADQSTPLHLATEFEQLEAVRQLIAHGAHPGQLRDSEGLTAYNIAEHKGNKAIRNLYESMFDGSQLERSLDAVSLRDREHTNQLALRGKQSIATEWKRLGNTFFEDNDYFGALRCYQEALKLEPEGAAGAAGAPELLHSNIAAALFNLADYEGALAAADRAVAANGRFAKGHFRRGCALAALSRLSEAKAALLQARTADPQAAAAIVQLAPKLAEVERLLRENNSKTKKKN